MDFGHPIRVGGRSVIGKRCDLESGRPLGDTCFPENVKCDKSLPSDMDTF